MVGKKVKKRKRQAASGQPYGLKVLWNYTALMAFLFCFLAFSIDFSMLFGYLVKNKIAFFLHSLYFIVMMCILFGLTYKKTWVYRFILLSYVYWLLNIIASFFYVSSIENQGIKAFYISVIPLLVLIFFINIFVLWFVYEKKSYFLKLKGKSDLTDMLFKRVMILFYIGFFIFLLFVFLQRMQFTPAYNGIENNVADKGPFELKDYCMSIENHDARVSCILYAVSTHKGLKENSDLCLSVDSPVCRFDCYRLMKNA
ncbi:MAG: hypothetical protein ACQESF_02865 [Nanobdellota archaeon]